MLFIKTVSVIFDDRCTRIISYHRVFVWTFLIKLVHLQKNCYVPPDCSYFCLIFLDLHFRYLSNKHLVDVTEVFKVVNTEKKARLIKLGFYVLFFGLVITRLANDAYPSILHFWWTSMCNSFVVILIKSVLLDIEVLLWGHFLLCSPSSTPTAKN